MATADPDTADCSDSIEGKEDRTIKVSCPEISKLKEKDVIIYFQRRQRSEGGPVEDVLKINGSYMVIFEDPNDAENVLNKRHELSGITLTVSSYRLYDDASGDDCISPLQMHEFEVTTSKQRYLQKFLANDVEDIKKYLRSLTYSEGKIMLHSQGSAFQKGVDGISGLLLRISYDTFSIAMPGVMGFLTSDTGRRSIDSMEDRFKCTIDVDEGDYAAIDIDSIVYNTDDRIRLITGKMEDQQADVLVNTVGQFLNLSLGSLSSALLQAGGDDLQRQCKVIYPKGIKNGQVAKTTGGRLNCKEVYHCCLPEWKGEETKQDLRVVVHRCLFEADKSSYRRIAFPAFGTNHLMYPAKVVAEVMMTVTEKFLSSPTSLVMVGIVLHPKDVEIRKNFEMTKQSTHGTSSSDAGQKKCPEVKEDVFEIGKMSLHIKKGDIRKENTACIVNSADISLTLNRGALSKAILAVCGEDLKRQCVLKVAEMQKKGIVVTTAPRLPSNYIIHVSPAHFHGNFKDIVKTCLKTAQGQSLSSIAFPPLGTGSGLSMESMTEMLINTLRDFEKKNQMIKEVRIVITGEDKRKLCIAKLDKIIRKAEKEKGFIRKRSTIKRKEEDKCSEAASPTIPEPTSDVMDDIIVCRDSSYGAEVDVSIYSEEPENRQMVFQQIQKLCRQHII